MFKVGKDLQLHVSLYYVLSVVGAQNSRLHFSLKKTLRQVALRRQAVRGNKGQDVERQRTEHKEPDNSIKICKHVYKARERERGAQKAKYRERKRKRVRAYERESMREIKRAEERGREKECAQESERARERETRQHAREKEKDKEIKRKRDSYRSCFY